MNTINHEKIAFENTLLGIIESLSQGKRTIKSIAAECGILENQVGEDCHKAVFARLSDCKTRAEFAAVFASLK